MRAYGEGAADERVLDLAAGAGDPDADATVAVLGRNVWAINALLKGISSELDPIPAAVPEPVRVLALPQLPPWADRHRLHRAQRFAQANLVPITVSLFCASLPTSYAAADGVKVLLASGRMREDLDRRVNETARFILEVLRPHGFEAGGRASVICGKVRFVHAAVRAALAPKWPGEVPIHQEHMLGTLMTFSVVVLRALMRFGIPLSDRERDDYVHLWCVVGALMGIPEPLLPQDFAAGDRLSRRIAERQFRPSEEGRLLMDALSDGYERHLMLPGGRTAALALVRHLLGDELAQLLALPPTPPIGRALELLRRTSIAPEVGGKLLDAVNTLKLKGVPVTFSMPTRLGRF